ncbi:protein TIFY 3-like [Solanum dulcamara]|uniref:protein TIFY 3-like n=1 Tax=Solanum dulcamara TaxID=45834 RepID=UPI00248534B1|nr:protein TIFY 3-like [Solanum dulcamara]
MNNSTYQLGHDLFNNYVPKNVQNGNNIVVQRRMSHLELAILPQLGHDDTKVPISQRDKSESAQLTIFYAGTVHVYDNIHVQKAESIMNLTPESCSQLISASINAKEIKPTQKSQVPPVYKFQEDLPIARRKSLKRFFDKRHNRIISKHPYASPECDDQSGNDNLKGEKKLFPSSM